MTKEERFEQAATAIMFQNASLFELEKDLGLVLRANKTHNDVTRAYQRGLKQGRGKVENELSMISIQLQSVLKVKKC